MAQQTESPVVIDLTPTWEETARICLTLVEYGDPKGRAIGRAEIERMGRLFDNQVRSANPAPDHSPDSHTV